jgi:hypothetical protein
LAERDACSFLSWSILERSCEYVLRLLLGDVMASDVRFAALRIDVETNAQTICPSVRVDPKKLGRTPNAPEFSCSGMR